MTDFPRTLETADRAEARARLLERAARKAVGADQAALLEMAREQHDYAAALREAIPAPAAEAEQVRLAL